MSEWVQANRESKCFQCNRMIQIGATIGFIKGSRRDGSEVYRPVHQGCYPPISPQSPPAAQSTGQAERSPPPATAPTGGITAPSSEPTPASGGTSLYVEVGGWVPAEYANEVVAAIVAAKLRKKA